MMIMDGVVSSSGSSWICIMWDARVVERVWGMVDEMGWGFRTLLGEIPALVFLAIGSVMNATLRISLTSLPVNMDFSGSCGNIGSILFFLSNVYVSSSSSEFFCVGSSFFYTFGPELGPTPAS
jgi:hypothetical protein